MTWRNPNYDGGGVVPSADLDFLGEDVFDPDPDEDKPSSPEVALWLAVVARVWEDAFACSDASIINTDRTCEPDMVRAEARRWLLLDFGEWKADREEVCARAGLDPDMIRAEARRRNKLAQVEDAERRQIEIATIDRAFRAMIARADSMTKAQISTSIRQMARREARCL